MAAASEETSVTYEELADIEREFEDVETEIIRQQVQLTRPLYEKRHRIVSQIPNFWPLVFEQAPPDIDEYIQPSDSALLLSSLTSLSVSHFEIEGGSGDPRSVSIRFEFAPNDYFDDAVLEKRFWHRRARGGWAGLVSEPVDIRWKRGKDLTAGLLGLVRRAWDEEQAAAAAQGGQPRPGRGVPLTPAQRALKAKIGSTGLGGLSFFAWFGFVGRRVSAEESRAAEEEERLRRARRLGGGEEPASSLAADDEDDDDDGDEEDDLEIFPDGDDLAVCITEDLWPGAIKYFTQAQEQDAMSDADFESDEDMDGDVNDDSTPTAKKKRDA